MSWENLLNQELALYMTKVTGLSEDSVTISNFFEILPNRVIYTDVITGLAKKWNSLDSNEQANYGIKFAGMYHVSRFIVMMDYFALKHERELAEKISASEVGKAFKSISENLGIERDPKEVAKELSKEISKMMKETDRKKGE